MRDTSLSEKTFLVTGAHGFIGAWIVKRLLERGARVVRFDQSDDARRLTQIMTEREVNRASLVIGDITSVDAISAVIAQFEVTHVIHLAGLQVPTCRSNPRLGALINVVGTVNVFEAARLSGDRIRKVVYASSAAVYGPIDDERALSERDLPEPATHYGAFKRCNETNARVFYLDHGVNSIGLRPLTIYGVGRDVGLTSDPTKAMKAAVLGRSYHIRFGGRSDFQYVADTADIFIGAAASKLEGAHVFNLHGETVSIAQVIEEIERVRPESRRTVTCADEPLSIPPEMDDTAIRAALGPVPNTPLGQGVEATMKMFSDLLREGRLDASELDQ